MIGWELRGRASGLSIRTAALPLGDREIAAGSLRSVPLVDPPDLPMWPTLRRLLTLWKGEWRSVALGLACALAYTVLSLAIPRHPPIAR